MDQVQPELTFDESVAQVMQTLPPVVRNYLAQGKYSVVTGNLMTKYSLHVDQGSILEREIMLLLMGIENPDEFTQALTEEAKLDQKTIDSIVQDVNTQIFIPLREEEMKSGEMNAQQPVKSAEPVKPVMPPPPPLQSTVPQPQPATPPPPPPPRSVNILSRPPATELPKGSYAPPLQSPSYFHLENKIAPPLRPAPTSPPLRQGYAGHSNATQGTAMDNSRLLEDHEESHIEFNKTSGETPLRQVLRTVVPTSLPGALPPQKPSAPIAPAQPYSVDPYRETIE